MTRLLPVPSMGLNAPVIVYAGDGGFVPSRLDITPGTEVLFVNESERSFWPASNSHPTHATLPAFDADRPIPPGETHAFTFESRGFWRFHNQLEPEQGGLVVVLGGESGPPAEPLDITFADRTFEPLGAVSTQEIVDLFSDDALLVRFMKRYGPEQTVRLLSQGEAQSPQRLSPTRPRPGTSGVRGVWGGGIRLVRSRVPGRFLSRRHRSALRFSRDGKPGAGCGHALWRRAQCLPPSPVHPWRRARVDGLDHI